MSVIKISFFSVKTLILFNGLILLSACAENPVVGEIFSRDYIDTVYYIQPGDELSVKFFYSPELNEEVIVRPDGRISLPLIQDILVAGKTTDELPNILKDLYATELKHPSITVIVRTFTSQKIYISGEVYDPKMIELSGMTTVLQAIAVAGGMKDTAYPDDIILIRKQQDAKPIIATLDISKVLDGSDTSQDVILKPYDIIFVPKSPIAKVNVWVDQYIRKMLPVEIRYGFGF